MKEERLIFYSATGKKVQPEYTTGYTPSNLYHHTGQECMREMVWLNSDKEKDMKKYYVFSDVHGEFDALQSNLIEMGFNVDDENDILFSLGDLFDRGPASDKVLEFMLDMWEKGRFIGVRGNHDDMLLDYLRGFSKTINFNLIYNGLADTVRQLSDYYYSADFLFFQGKEISKAIFKKYPKIVDFLLDLKPMYEFGNFVFLHAGCDTDNGKEWFVYNWSNTPAFVQNFDPKDKTYVFGHWHASKLYKDVLDIEAPDDKIFIHNNFIGIDMKTNISKEVAVGYLFENEDGVYEMVFHEDRKLA